MALKRRTCSNHPDRMAIGVCVITSQPICAECSTRYEGVNYSREGLEILRQRRDEEQRKLQRGSRGMSIAGALLAPLAVFLLFQAYRIAFLLLIDLRQIDMGILF